MHIMIRYIAILLPLLLVASNAMYYDYYCDEIPPDEPVINRISYPIYLKGDPPNCSTYCCRNISYPFYSNGDTSKCGHRSCGNIHNISYPFYLKGDPDPNCGDHLSYNYELACEHNRTILYINSNRYYVEAISYNNSTIRVVDPDVRKRNCSSIPRNSFTNINLGYLRTTEYNSFRYSFPIVGRSAYPYFLPELQNYTILMDCENPIHSSQYVDTTPCINGRSSLRKHSYATVQGEMQPSDVNDLCTMRLMVPTRLEEEGNYSFSDIHDELVWGFELLWIRSFDCIDCQGRAERCYAEEDNNVRCSVFSGSYNPKWDRCYDTKLQCAIHAYYYCLGPSFTCDSWVLHIMAIVAIYGIMGIVLILAARTSCGTLCFLAFLIYKFRRRHLSMYDTIEEFLQGNNNIMPIRYSYSEIKKMTKYFKDKLGQGGYGSVFRGKLRSGRLVAVKMLHNSKGNGQDFINEVLTIGRIHHVNVVQLTGFCAEGSKWALVYDFMPNGSLEKYIFGQEEGGISLSWEKMYEISLGVARGIEYLHRGCDMQILHFDIKPHNILLDHNFTPKVSDFGLAKLYPTNESILSLTAARGTMGYIAPELFYKNIGGISYKVDVYSFGMLLMEMTGRRKNLNAHVEHSSQIYFPSWIYDRFNQGEDMEMGDATEVEKILAKKMIIVALWCIQLKPIDRPSMSKVLEMLEGSVELLQMPPKPFVCPQEMPIEDHATNANHT